jgi:hypothetical protein
MLQSKFQFGLAVISSANGQDELQQWPKQLTKCIIKEEGNRYSAALKSVNSLKCLHGFMLRLKNNITVTI